MTLSKIVCYSILNPFLETYIQYDLETHFVDIIKRPNTHFYPGKWFQVLLSNNKNNFINY